jgi:hypothetical protein
MAARKFTALDSAELGSSTPVSTYEQIKGKIMSSNQDGRPAVVHLVQSVKDTRIFTVPLGQELTVDLNSKECRIAFVVEGTLNLFNGLLTQPITCSGGILNCDGVEFAGASVATGNISNSTFSDCIYPATFSTGVITHTVLTGRMATVEDELVLGSAVNTPVAIKVDLAGGLTCYDPDDSNISLTGDYTNTSNQGTDTNILARNILLSSGSAVSYTNATAMPLALGGLPAGRTFSSESITSIFNDLFYPYISPTFSAFSISGQSTTLECGDSITSGSKTFTWSTTTPANINANSITITNHSDSITLGSSLANDGTESLSLASAITKTSQASHTFRIAAVNTNSITFTRDFNVNWRFRLYYGENTTATLNETQIEALGTSTLTSSAAATYSFLAGGRKHICYPTTFTLLTTFKDALTLLNVDMNPVYTVSITNSFGVTQDYYCHSTVNVLGSAIDIICT